MGHLPNTNIRNLEDRERSFNNFPN